MWELCASPRFSFGFAATHQKIKRISLTHPPIQNIQAGMNSCHLKDAFLSDIWRQGTLDFSAFSAAKTGVDWDHICVWRTWFLWSSVIHCGGVGKTQQLFAVRWISTPVAKETCLILIRIYSWVVGFSVVPHLLVFQGGGWEARSSSAIQT